MNALQVSPTSGVKSSRWFDSRDILMLIVSTLVGILSSVAVETVKSNYAVDQAKFERKLTAITDAANAMNVFLNLQERQLEDLNDIFDEQINLLNQVNMTPNAKYQVFFEIGERITRVQQDFRLETDKLAFSIERHALVLHALFGGSEPKFDYLNEPSPFVIKLQELLKRHNEEIKNARTPDQVMMIKARFIPEMQQMGKEALATLNTLRNGLNKELLSFTRELSK